MADEVGSDGGTAAGKAPGGAASRRRQPGTTGRVTPKGTVPGARRPGPAPKGAAPRGTAPKAHATKDRVAPASSRYTPPVAKELKVSPPWVPILMFALLGVGVLIIILNYLGVLPGESDNKYLLLGLGLITGGFITATQYR